MSAAIPAANSAPMTPASTSPEPAVAAHDPCARFTYAVPSGRAMTVTLPLSRTVALSRAASDRVASTRSGPGGPPANRANSPACGVRTVAAGRDATRSARSGCSASIVRASASTRTGKLVERTRRRVLV
ncbi:Uncharacterised protein [Mycobacteroides abscessus subsp. abscessus]|nr:Uncharacterised protein [Mycobacteroides abscessus subsp. abscessus]